MKIRITDFIFKSVLLLTLVALINSCTTHTNKNIRIGILNGPSAVSFIQLIENKTYIKNKEIELIIKDDPMQIQALMMRNELEFAILPTVMAANLYNKGLKFKILACPIWGTLYLLTNDENINFKNLSGQSIAVFGRSTTSDVLLNRYLIQNEIENTNINYTFSSNAEIAKALLQKNIKIAVVSEPMVSALMKQDKHIKIIEKLDCKDYINNSDKNVCVQTAFLVNDEFSKSNADLVRPVCEAYLKSCNFTSEQPAATAILMTKHKISPSVDIAKISLPLCNIHYVSSFAIEQELYRYLNIFYQYNPKSVGGKIPDKSFIYQIY